MPRYLIEREFPDGLTIPQDDIGAILCGAVIDINAEEGATWVHSYVTPDRKRTILHLGRADARGRPPGGEPQQAADLADHRGSCSRSVLLQIVSDLSVGQEESTCLPALAHEN